MKLDKELREYAKKYETQCSKKLDEQKVKETIQKSCKAFYHAQQRERLSYREFFWFQLQLIKKRWWILQALLLLGMWALLEVSDAAVEVQRGMSIAATLFIILMVPEIWKNQENNAMEIETASFYSLKQIYSVRLSAFGLIDLLLLTCFCMGTTVTQNIPFYEMTKQMIIPMLIVAASCFLILCNKNRYSQSVAIITCILVSGLWLIFALNDSLYKAASPVLWGMLFAVAVLLLVFSIKKILVNCDQYQEVVMNGIEIR